MFHTIHRPGRLHPASFSSADLGVHSSTLSTAPSFNSSNDLHVSVFRTLQMEMHIQSPSTKFMKYRHERRSIPVFSETDQVGGHIILSPTCSPSGKLVITLQGTFLYSSSNVHGQEPLIDGFGKQKHVFFSTSTSIVIPRNSRLPFCDAFKSGPRRSPSASCLQIPAAKRTHYFKFDLGKGCRPGEDLPPTFSSPTLADGVIPTRPAPSPEVLYTVSASWEPIGDGLDRALLEAPILYYPDPDFHSFDGLSVSPEFWLEMPLKTDRPIPFQCAITLPSPLAFSRPQNISYFVVFKTSPRSSSLVREIASDASICVSLRRHVTINDNLSLPPTPPDSPTSFSDDLRPLSPSPRKLFQRITKNRSPSVACSCPEDIFRLADSLPTPILPVSTAFSDSCTLWTDMTIGFPKRPRHRCHPMQHPTMEQHRSLPDGLCKGALQLHKEMIPSIDWAGLSVKYYLDVSLVFRQDELRARIPIRVF